MASIRNTLKLHVDSIRFKKFAHKIPENWINAALWKARVGVLVLVACSYLPRMLMLWLGHALGWYLYKYNHKRRTIVINNLELCFPNWPVEKRLYCARQHFRSFAQVMVDFGMLLYGSDRRIQRYVHVDGIEHWHAAVAADRPVILLCPHMIATDMTGSTLALYYPACAMMKPMRNPYMNERLTKGRARYGLELINRTNGMKALIRNLKNRIACIYIPDEDFGNRSSILVPFFGVPTATLTTLARIAKMTNAIVLPLAPNLDTSTGNYYLTINPPMENFPTNDAYQDARGMNAVFESIILRAPEQYMWTLRWFKTTLKNAQ